MKKILSDRKITGILLIAAVLLLAVSAVGTSRAAFNYVSENYNANISMNDIGVQILENGNPAGGELLQNLLKEGEEILPGKKYGETVTVMNTGTIDEYIRVEVYKYWVDGSGSKLTNLSPELIEIGIGSGWIKDDSKTTAERTVLYYPSKVSGNQGTTPVIESITLSQDLPARVSQQNTGGTVTTEYQYDGVKFIVEVKANAVQTHNGEKAIKSAWGIDAKVGGDGSLSIGG